MNQLTDIHPYCYAKLNSM